MVLDIFRYCVSLKIWFFLFFLVVFFFFLNEESEVQNIDSG